MQKSEVSETTIAVEDLTAPPKVTMLQAVRRVDGNVIINRAAFPKHMTDEEIKDLWLRLQSNPIVVQAGLSTLQSRVDEWMAACFSADVAKDTVERADRFIEEALELVQSTGYSADRAHALVEYVFNRPIGVAPQEVGGVMVTLAALCTAERVEMEACAEIELARIWTKIDEIHAKQAAKPRGSALPSAADGSPLPALTIWAIYDHPSDFPDQWVARAYRGQGGAVIASDRCIRADSYDDLIARLPDGLMNIGRYPEDDPVIKECWV